MTTLANVTKAIETLGFNANQNDLAKRVFKTVNSLVFHQNYPTLIERTLKSSLLGDSLKGLCVSLASRDGRKVVQCPVTFKDILVQD